MKKVVTFGEIIMRISPPGNKKLIQSNQLEYYFGGTEVNVAISLSQLGNGVNHVSAVSNDFLGKAATSYLNTYGVDTDFVRWLYTAITRATQEVFLVNFDPILFNSEL